MGAVERRKVQPVDEGQQAEDVVPEDGNAHARQGSENGGSAARWKSLSAYGPHGRLMDDQIWR